MTRRYKIAMVAACPFPCQRGTPIRIFRMADALGRRGHEVHVVTYHLGEACDADTFQVHRIRDVRTYRKLTPGPTYQKLAVLDTLLLRELSKVLRNHAIEVIHAHHFEGLLVGWLGARRRYPIVFDAHTLLESELPYFGMGLPGSAKRWVGRRFDKHLPRRADHTIAVSDEIKAQLITLKATDPQHISVIPNGVDLDSFNVEPPAGNGKQRTAIFTGNLAAYQGVELMLQAFAELRKSRQDVRLRIVSDSSFDSYEALAQTLGIREAVEVIHSEFKDVPRYLAEADVALNPRTECAGTPQKLLNYMAAGKPIVSFAGSAKHLTHAERGWVIADGDIRGFANAMDKLLGDPELARHLGDNARRFVHAELSWNKTAERTEAVYAQVTGDAE